ncbi:MAG: ACP phosphodiesterase [Ferruginibacter sp.]
MNYLGHAFFSPEDADILLGNMISDFVKGNKKYTYPENVQFGMRAHRALDAFTDGHGAIKEMINIFRPSYRLYAAPVTDVILDYFIANSTANFPTLENLQAFSKRIYQKLEENEQLFPEKFKRMFPYMKTQDWLYNYHTHEGILQSLGGLHHRAKYMKPPAEAFEIFEEEKQLLEPLANIFITDVKKFSEAFFSLY